MAFGREDFQYICPSCGELFPEETVALGFFCCSSQCTKQFLRRNQRWVVAHVIKKFFSDECPRSWKEPAIRHGIDNKRLPLWKFTQATVKSLERIEFLDYVTKEWSGSVPTSVMISRIRLERLRMIRDQEVFSCSICGARFGLYESCPSCRGGEDKE